MQIIGVAGCSWGHPIPRATCVSEVRTNALQEERGSQEGVGDEPGVSIGQRGEGGKGR